MKNIFDIFFLSGNTALIQAIKQDHVEVVKILLENKADMNLQDFLSGYTALIEAIRAGQVEVVKILLANKADMNLQTKE